ncbi:MAG: ABC transporter ATP-binding protein [Saprospiraceae bacterium]|nr:ABC transporter ATP-binding protein [Saprospiraceae bacterium]
MQQSLLHIDRLGVSFQSDDGQTVQAIDQLSISLARGECLGIVGESGSGKSLTALSIMRLLPDAANIDSGQIHWFNQESETPVDLLALSQNDMRTYRGARIGMVFQEPMTSLNPVFRCGDQVCEAILQHQSMGKAQARIETLALFNRVRLPNPERIFDAYPHQISGGQKQRVMIAMALSCRPDLLIADEPTTALDVTVQKAILDLLKELRAEYGLSMLFISHDLGVISEVADRVAVMYKGRVVEAGTVKDVMQNPEHPYTRGLMACRPSLHGMFKRLPTLQDFFNDPNSKPVAVAEKEVKARREKLYTGKPLLKVEDVHVRYPSARNWLGQTSTWLEAVDGVSFDVFEGETFGIAGESGCGKTTLGRTIARLTDAHSGSVSYKGSSNVLALSSDAFRPLRREIQVVFQDPYASLNPRMRIGEAILEPMVVHGLHGDNKKRRDKVVSLLETVGLQADHFRRYPHEFSGGQRQRICIARALAVEPRLLICDEMVSALDVSVQATVLNLLLDLREQFGLTYLFISHDLSVIRQMCDRLLIMNKGKAEALGYPEDIYNNPGTEYVKNLIDSVPGV